MRRTLRARDHVTRAIFQIFMVRTTLLTRTSFLVFLQEFVVFFSHFVVCHFPVYLLGLNLEFEPTIQGELFLNSSLKLSLTQLRQRNARSRNVFKCLDYCIKQIDSILPWVCTLITHRGRQNVVRTSVTTSLFSQRFDVICALSEYRRTAKWNLFVKYIFFARIRAA